MTHWPSETATKGLPTPSVNDAPMCCCEAEAMLYEPADLKPRPIPVWKIVGGFCLVALVLVVAISVARASEQPPPRDWIVWLVDEDRPWTSPKGHQATATGPTACSLSLHEAALVSPKGTRLACRKVRP